MVLFESFDITWPNAGGERERKLGPIQSRAAINDNDIGHY